MPPKKTHHFNLFGKKHDKSDKSSKHDKDVSTPSSPASPHSQTKRSSPDTSASTLHSSSQSSVRSVTPPCTPRLRLVEPVCTPRADDEKRDEKREPVAMQRTSSLARSARSLKSSKSADANARRKSCDARRASADGYEAYKTTTQNTSDMSQQRSDDELSDGDEPTNKASARVNILMNEALADTPSFRASMAYIHPLICQMEKWFDDLEFRTRSLASQIETVKESALSLSGFCEPSLARLEVLEHDYTCLALSRYSEMQKQFWAGVHARALENAHEVKQTVQKLHASVFAKYFSAQALYSTKLNEFHEAIVTFLRLPPHAEHVAEQDASACLEQAQWSYVLAATRLAFQVNKLETECSLAILELLPNQNYGEANLYATNNEDLFVGSEYPPAFVDKPESAFELLRLRALAKQLRESVGGFYMELKNTRQVSVAQYRPSARSNTLYRDLSSPVAESLDLTYKTGWVACIEAASPASFGLYYAYVKNGFFGLLKPHDGSVLESMRFVLAECKVAEVESEDRRFLLKLSNASDSVTLQTVGKAEYTQWKAVLEEQTHASEPQKPALSQKDLITLPWNSSFQINTLKLRSDCAPGAATVAERIHSVDTEIQQERYSQNTGILAFSDSYRLTTFVPARVPVLTAGSYHAVVGNWFYDPQGTLNSMDANYWGCVGFSDTVGSHDEVTYSNSFPTYPKEYPRKLILQDMGMRAVTSHCAVTLRPNHDDLVLFLFRATCTLGEFEAPLRVYVTRSRIVLYTVWAGLVNTQIYELDKVEEVDCEPGVETSLLSLIINNSSSTSSTNSGSAQTETISMKMYVDSAILVKKRLELVIANSRSNDSDSYRDLFEPLSVTLPESLPRKKNELKKEPVSTYLYNQSIDGASELETHGEGVAQGMHTKIAEDTFSVSSKALFLAIFGPRSPVFNSHQAVVFDCTYSAGPWFRRAKRLVRKVQVEFPPNSSPFEFLGGNAPSNFSFEQSVVCQTRDLFIVVEKRAACVTSGGEKFHLEFKYFIYSTGQGSYLQIWSRTVWSKPPKSSASTYAIGGFAKMCVRPIALRARKVVNTINSSIEAREQFGNVHAMYEANDSTTSDVTLPMRQFYAPSVKWAVSNCWRLPLRFLVWFAVWSGKSVLFRILNLQFSFLFIMALSASSLVANYLMYERMNASYWQMYFDNAQTDALVHALGVLPKGEGVEYVFKRAIYTQDIDDAFKYNASWVLSGANATLPCAHKFLESAELAAWVNDYGDVFWYEPQFENSATRIANLRQDFAITRNRLLTELFVLNAREKEELTAEYKHWVYSESMMCSSARNTVVQLNDSVAAGLREYCISCLEEMQRIM